MTATLHTLPRLRPIALTVWARNLRVWRRLLGPSLVLNFGEPTLYLVALGLGLGVFIGEMEGTSYIAFLASGIIASSAMNTASFEGMYSVYTRMVPQRTYDALLITPLDVDDIVAGEMLWCATKSLISGTAILIVAAALGITNGWQALWVIPILILVGLCFAGPALIMATLSPGYNFFEYYFTLVLTPLLLLSGVFYPAETLPDAIGVAVQFLPLSHAVDLIRPLVLGQALTTPLLHVAILALYATVAYYLSVIFARRRLMLR